MYKDAYQQGLLSVLYSIGAKPLTSWGKNMKQGYVKRVIDEELNSFVIEIVGTNVMQCYITIPCNLKETLGITMPFLVMVIKNLNKYFTFEMQIIDNQNTKRRFRLSNYQSASRVKTFVSCLPLGLNPGWNQIIFNMADFTRRTYGTHFIELLRLSVHANCRIRRIYFSKKLYTDEELPADYKICLPKKKKPEEAPPKEPEKTQTS